MSEPIRCVTFFWYYSTVLGKAQTVIGRVCWGATAGQKITTQVCSVWSHPSRNCELRCRAGMHAARWKLSPSCSPFHLPSRVCFRTRSLKPFCEGKLRKGKFVERGRKRREVRLRAVWCWWVSRALVVLLSDVYCVMMLMQTRRLLGVHAVNTFMNTDIYTLYNGWSDHSSYSIHISI